MRQAGIEPATNSLEGGSLVADDAVKRCTSAAVSLDWPHGSSCPDALTNEIDRHRDRPRPLFLPAHVAPDARPDWPAVAYYRHVGFIAARDALIAEGWEIAGSYEPTSPVVDGGWWLRRAQP